MSLQFVDEGDGSGSFRVRFENNGYVEIGVSNSYDPPYSSSETIQDQYNRINDWLNGIPNQRRALFSDRNGSSDFYVDIVGDIFTLHGGEFGPSFGGDCTIKCSYSKNKTEIDKFMCFMLSKVNE